MRLLFSTVMLLTLAACAKNVPVPTPDLPLTGAAVTQPITQANPVERALGMFPAPDGTPLFEQWWRPAQPTSALVLVHGLKDHSTRYDGFAHTAAAAGMAVFAFDLRGHGRSGGAPVSIKSFDEYISDLTAFLERTQERQPGVPLFLIGHSMGGAIALGTVIQQQPALRGLILSAAALKPGADVSPLLIAVTRKLGSLFPTLGVLDLPDEKFSRDPATSAQDKADPLIHHEAGPARTAAELLNIMERNMSQCAQVTTPLLILHGTADVITNPVGSQELEKCAASKDKTLKSYAGLYHDLLHEPERSLVTQDIMAFVAAHK